MNTPKLTKIVVIGGGTGSFTLLSALKERPYDLTAIVNMADDGGSTGVLRDELGVLPPGDIRQCLVALSTASEEVRQLFNYRFPEGTFGGHSFGNLFLSAVERMTNNFEDAVRMASDVLQLKGRVMPVTLQNCNLVLYNGRTKIKGEYKIANQSFSNDSRPKLALEPAASITDSASRAILAADMVVIAPGDLYGSLAPTLLVDGVSSALSDTAAQVVYVANLVNKPFHNKGYTVSDYATEIERIADRPILDTVLYNTDEPEAELLRKYALDDEYPVTIDKSVLNKAHYNAIGKPFLSRSHSERNQNDSFIKRSLIRHDGVKVADILSGLLQE